MANREAEIEAVEGSIGKGEYDAISNIDGMIVEDLRDRLSDREIAEILLHIKELAREKDGQWFHDALDRVEKLENRGGNPYKHKRTKVEQWSDKIRNAYHNPPKDGEGEIRQGYWRKKWREAKWDCSDSTLRRIRTRLEEEYNLKLDPVHGNVRNTIAEPTIEELDE